MFHIKCKLHSGEGDSRKYHPSKYDNQSLLGLGYHIPRDDIFDCDPFRNIIFVYYHCLSESKYLFSTNILPELF